MPALKAAAIPVGTFERKPSLVPSSGDVLLTCGICDWQTTRPERYAESAQDAHAIQHRRGLR